MKNNLRKTIEDLNPGDLICCQWYDASIGKSSGSGMAIDVPVRSWGIYIGLIGEKTKHLVVAQNSFHYSTGHFDLDYTAVPLTWAIDVNVLQKEHISAVEAKKLVNSFVIGGNRRFIRQRTFQRRLKTHERPN